MKDKHKRLLRLGIFSLLFFWLYIIVAHLPWTFFVLIEVLLIIKYFLTRKFLEKQIIKINPKYQKLKNWKKQIILILIYIAIFMLIKFVIINLIAKGIFNINFKEQISNLVNNTNPNI